MGNEMSNATPDSVVIPKDDHDHDHDHDHSHGHGDAGHGHSHNGQPCHGHGGDAGHGHSHAAPEAHGHSHNGQPCHGHGGDAGHGHSHAAAEAHGHSHNGQPCHGHGAPGQGQGQAPPDVMRKMKAVDVFMRAVVLPRLPIVFSKFAPAEETEETTKVNGVTAPKNQSRFMTPDQFHKCVYSIQQAIADADFHGVVRDEEVSEMEFSFYHMARLVETPDHTQTLPADFKLAQPMFVNLTAFMVARLTAARYDAVKLLLTQQWGFDLKLPEIPLTNEEVMSSHIREFVMTQVAPILATFIEEKMEANKDDADPVKRWAIRDTLDSIVQGMEESKNEDQSIKQITQMVKTLDTSMVLNQCLGTDGAEGVSPKFLAYVVLTNWATLMLAVDADVATFVFRIWGLEVDIAEEDELTNEVGALTLEQDADQIAAMKAETEPVLEEDPDQIAAMKAETEPVLEEDPEQIAAMEAETKPVLEEDPEQIAAMEAETKSVLEEDPEQIAVMEAETAEEDTVQEE